MQVSHIEDVMWRGLDYPAQGKSVNGFATSLSLAPHSFLFVETSLDISSGPPFLYIYSDGPAKKEGYLELEND